ncbi:MAG: cobyric acid synthase [ANME-2 cluster archaeon]|nr:cobyric acid synthase [ANME-2 cluster archaeon]MDF1558141.1 cobyric acid synthase [ANME-2 cluster archaeon]
MTNCAKPLMVLGTGSHVGKSVIVTALCRIFAEEGFNVAPFKAQNMSLNSWITDDGSEIGIAQATQAKACGIQPTADMNPILLKPKGDRQSQVIVLGKPFADRTAGDYYDSIEDMMRVVEGAYERLAQQYDIIVIEGAGGAAEINLYHRDVVNIGTARMLRPPIILVGDIERGGVFASIYGTLKLLPDDIAPLIRGIIINKFRGDPAILEPGLKELEELTGVPVLGVIPYTELFIPSEDSVSIADKKKSSGSDKDLVDIAVLRLPRISNFTDFEPLEQLAIVRYVEPNEDLGNPDALILPGTKNTIDDLRVLQDFGTEARILELAKAGIPIIGICGGFQMLGKTITDSGIEGTGGDAVSVNGLGLLDIATDFIEYEKHTVQTEKTVTGEGPILGRIQGQQVSGYEIHMGQTHLLDAVPAFDDDGCIDDTGLIWGTYLHGLFENEHLRDALLEFLYTRRGLSYSTIKKGITNMDPYHQLATHFQAHIDMDTIEKMLTD